jgi:thiamine-phosphate pyrophosphorylase
MNGRQKVWPREWLMTDERMGQRLWDAIDRLQHGRGGVAFRHYELEAARRTTLARRVAEICRRRELTLAIARDSGLARAVGAQLVHNPVEPVDDLPFSRAVHSIAEAEAARAEGAALVFVSPVRPTRSHPGSKGLGKARAARIAHAAGVPAIALGGIDRLAWMGMRDVFYGWAGIDAWLEGSSYDLIE